MATWVRRSGVVRVALDTEAVPTELPESVGCHPPRPLLNP
jgi:hypothetical protein